ncbi:MAG: hypothetical protein K0S65_5431 [Labilithrix sp.]|nr:hypothetical protein [Labilithrix sp.]
MFLGIMKRKTFSTTAPVLGVDIGRVIINGDGPGTSFIGGFEDDAMRAPALDGAFASLTRLRTRFDGRVWLISKCGPRVQERTRRWLDRHRFFQETGIPYGQLRFCRERVAGRRGRDPGSARCRGGVSGVSTACRPMSAS